MIKNQTLLSHNFKLYSVIKPKIKKYRSNNNTIISIPISINKKRNKNSINIPKKDLFNKNKLFFDFSLNKRDKNNWSTKKEKSNDDFSNELLKSNDLNNLKKNREFVKIELDMINKMFKDNKNYINNLMKKIDLLRETKNNKQKLLENNLSKKETLEEMYKTIINNIKNSKFSNINENFCFEITLEEFKNNNIDSYINSVFKAFNYINNYNDTKYFKFISITITQEFNNLFNQLNNNKIKNINDLIKKFFFVISIKISSQIIIKSSEKDIYIMLQILFKLNVISGNIEKVIHYLDNEYKQQKNEISDKISENEKKINSLQLKKEELLNIKNKINEEINIFSQKKTPFYERTICNKRLKFKKLMLINFSSTIHISKNGQNKSIPNSNRKKNLNSFYIQRRKLSGNLFNILNKNNETDKSKVFYYNKISEGKIINKGISMNSSCEKDFKNFSKIEIKNKNNKLKKNDCSKSKEFDNIQLNNNNKIQNGIYIYNNIEKNISKNKIINETNNKQKLTEINTSNNFKINLTKKNNNIIKKKRDSYNGKYTCIIKKGKAKEYGLYISNNTAKNKILKTERLTGDINNSKINVNSGLLSDNIRPIYKQKKYNLSKIFSLYENNSFEKKKRPINITDESITLNQFLSNRDHYKYTNDINYDKKGQNSTNLICTVKNKKKIIKEGNRIEKKGKNSCFIILDKTDINLYSPKNSYFNNVMESFCYYKLLEKESELFNPLKNNENLNKLGYNEGYISIDEISSCLKFTSNYFLSNIDNKLLNSNCNNNNENNNKYLKTEINLSKSKLNIINIKLKEITNIYLNKLMKNIIKIHSIFLKYNANKNQINSFNNIENDFPKKKFSCINELLNIKEIMNIKDMDQSEKIKAGFCNFFSFIIEFENIKKIECILINFIQFNNWYKYLEDIVINNIKLKKISNGNTSTEKHKNNRVFKLKSFYTKLKNKQDDLFQRSITEKKARRNNEDIN